MGKLGRNKLLCLVKGHDTEEPLEGPSEILGIVTHRFNEKVEECLKDLYRNLISAGYKRWLK
jgi:predicted nucleotide-binding protein